MTARSDEQVWHDFDLVQAAARYAAEAHRHDLRKGTAVPYLSHLWSVAALVLEFGGDDHQVAAALLHDVVEDHGGPAALADIGDRFGDDVARLVEHLSDSVVDTTDGASKAPWAQRKATYLARLEAADARVALVSACDKLHNARSILADLRVVGDELWDRFSVSDPARQLWYYTALADTLRPLVPTPLADELDRTVTDIAALAGVEPAPSPAG